MTQPDPGDVIATLVEVTFIYDPALGSPTETQSLGGKQYGVPRDSIPLPRRGVLFGQPGFGRQVTIIVGAPPNDVAVMRWEWVLQGATDPVDTFVDNLTGRGGWVVPNSRAVIKLLVQRLFSAGIPRSTITSQVPQMYQAVAAEVRAEDAAP